MTWLLGIGAFAKRIPWQVWAAISLVVGTAAFMTQCQKSRNEDAQAKVDRSQADAFTNSAADAVNAQGAANAREAESDALTRSNERTIRDAQGSTDKVNPAVRDAGLDSLCRRPSYRDSERCRMRGAAARGLEEGR